MNFVWYYLQKIDSVSKKILNFNTIIKYYKQRSVTNRGTFLLCFVIIYLNEFEKFWTENKKSFS
jgi:hypothetical protein